MTDWGLFGLYVAFVTVLGIAAHVLEVIEQARSDRKFKGWK